MQAFISAFVILDFILGTLFFVTDAFFFFIGSPPAARILLSNSFTSTNSVMFPNRRGPEAVRVLENAAFVAFP
jgi:hypothetical protein